MKSKTIKGKLIAKQDGIYTLYVFELNENEFVMCTKLPNWDVSPINIGDIGFVTFEEAVAGEKYFNPKTEDYHVYNYTNVYFKNFLKEEQTQENKIIII